MEINKFVRRGPAVRRQKAGRRKKEKGTYPENTHWGKRYFSISLQKKMNLSTEYQHLLRNIPIDNQRFVKNMDFCRGKVWGI